MTKYKFFVVVVFRWFRLSFDNGEGEQYTDCYLGFFDSPSTIQQLASNCEGLISMYASIVYYSSLLYRSIRDSMLVSKCHAVTVSFSFYRWKRNIWMFYLHIHRPYFWILYDTWFGCIFFSYLTPSIFRGWSFIDFYDIYLKLQSYIYNYQFERRTKN